MVRLFALGLIALTLTATAKADLIVDDFIEPAFFNTGPPESNTVPFPAGFPAGTTTTGATRTVSAVNGTASFTSGTSLQPAGQGEITTVANLGGTASLTLEYSGLNNLGGFVENFLRFNLVTLAPDPSTGTLAVSLRDVDGNSLFANTVSIPSSINPNGEIFIDITSASNIGSLDTLAVTFTGNPVAATLDIGSIEFTSAPEPASMALAGLAVVGMGGVIARRRRKSAPAAV